MNGFFCNCSAVHAALHTTICGVLSTMQLSSEARLLDVGCWDATHTLDYAQALGLAPEGVFGLEGNEAVQQEANKRIHCSLGDLENDRFPFDDATFDVVIANQVFEHLKNVFLPMSEVWRVLKPGGKLVFSVPNLSSAHNRILTLLGRQPTSIRIMGPHVRAFAYDSITPFLELNKKFVVEDSHGVGFYPAPMFLAGRLARLMKGMSHTVVWIAAKQDVPGPNWYEEINRMSLQSSFGHD